MKNEESQPMLENTPFDQAIVAALENAPQPAIPADFAARVAAKAALLPARKPASQARYGRTVSFIAIAVLTVALFALAPHVAPAVTNVNYLIEMLVLVQLGGLSYWLMRSSREPY